MKIGRFNANVFSGAVFGKLTVIKKLPRELVSKNRYHYRVLCKCHCGKTSTPHINAIVSGATTSCGCHKKTTGGTSAKKRVKPGVGYGKIVPGAVLGRLTVICRVGSSYKVKCRCSCGTKCAVSIDGLVSGNSKSCGCLKGDVTTARNKAMAKYQGFSTKFPRTWLRWSNMMDRCYNSNSTCFKEYGGSGVFVCPWLRESPWNMKALLGLCKKAKPSLDRFPIHNGNYTCGQCQECKAKGWALNVRWATRKEQSLNRGKFNVEITAFGETMKKSEWMEKTGLSWSCITHRIRRGWPVERVLTTPDKSGNCLDLGSSSSVNV